MLSIAVVATADGCSQAHDRNFVIYAVLSIFKVKVTVKVG